MHLLRHCLQRQRLGKYAVEPALQSGDHRVAVVAARQARGELALQAAAVLEYQRIRHLPRQQFAARAGDQRAKAATNGIGVFIAQRFADDAADVIFTEDGGLHIGFNAARASGIGSANIGDQQRFANHWFSTATPSFLIKLLRKKQIPAYQLENLEADGTVLDSADVNNISVNSLLFQTGYLTVKRIEITPWDDEIYTLGYPNHEVSQAFQQHLLADYLDVSTGQVSTAILGQLRKALTNFDAASFIKPLQAVFASIPHQLFLPQEAYYHSVIYLTLKLLGFNIQAEQMTKLGRIDAVLELPNAVYILEFKMTTAETAIQQIRDKQYAQPFRARGKPIILLGIAFDKERRNIVDWATERM